MKALINCEIAAAFSKASGIQAIALQPYSRLDFPVASHADMLFCIINDVVFCYEDYVKENGLADVIGKEGYKIVFVSNRCEKEYPKDISLNVLIMGNTLFCNERYAAEEILTYAKNSGYSVVNVKQGYSACSTLVLDENTAITSDFGIAKAIEGVGKAAVLIDSKDILLSGYDHGFIGGSTVKIGEKIYIFGELKGMKCERELMAVANEKNCDIISISSGRVSDFGGVKLL